MVSLKENTFVDSCSVEGKRFSVSLGKDGGIVRLLEDRRNRTFNVLLSRVAACWLMGIVEEGSGLESDFKFWRRYRGNGFSIIVDIMVNFRGSCLRILKVAQGVGRMILIPEGHRRNGWRVFARILRSILGRWSANQSYLQRNAEVPKEVNYEVNYAEAVKAQKNHRMTEVPAQKGQPARGPVHSTSNSSFPKRTSLAAAVRRFNGYDSWERIFEAIRGSTKGDLFLSSFSGNKSILWCKDQQTKNEVLKNSIIFIKRRNVAVVSDWIESDQWEGNLLRVKNEWIGIEGLPFDLWNIHALKTIGNLCGGIIKVAQETLDLSDTRFAKIQVKGRKDELLSPLLELPFGEVQILVGLFNLDETPRGQIFRSIKENAAAQPSSTAEILKVQSDKGKKIQEEESDRGKVIGKASRDKSGTLDEGHQVQYHHTEISPNYGTPKGYQSGCSHWEKGYLSDTSFVPDSQGISMEELAAPDKEHGLETFTHEPSLVILQDQDFSGPERPEIILGHPAGLDTNLLSRMAEQIAVIHQTDCNSFVGAVPECHKIPASTPSEVHSDLGPNVWLRSREVERKAFSGEYRKPKKRHPKSRCSFAEGVIQRWSEFSRKKTSPIIRKSPGISDSDPRPDGRKKGTFGKSFSQRRWIGEQEVDSVFNPLHLGLDEDDKIEPHQDSIMELHNDSSFLEDGSSEDTFASSNRLSGGDHLELLEGVAALFGSGSDSISEWESCSTDAPTSLQVPSYPIFLDPLVYEKDIGLCGEDQTEGKKESRKKNSGKKNSGKKISGQNSCKDNSKRSKKKTRELRNLDFNMSFGKSKPKGRKYVIK